MIGNRLHGHDSWLSAAARRVRGVAAFALALSVVGAIPAADPQPYPPDIQRIRDRGRLIVAQYNGTRPGFFFFDKEGRFPDAVAWHGSDAPVIGVDVELATRLAERLGVALELRREYLSFTGVCEAVARHEADIGFSKLTITPERGLLVRFSKPYVTLRVGLLINRLMEANSGTIDDPKRLCNQPGRRIAVERGTAFVTIVRQFFPKAELLELPDLEATYAAVARGDAIALVNDEWNIGTMLRRDPARSLRTRLTFLAGRSNGIAAAIDPGAPQLASFFDLLLEQDGLGTTPQELMDRFLAQEGGSRFALTMTRAEQATEESGARVGVMSAVAAFFLIGAWLWLAKAGSPAVGKSMEEQEPNL